MTSHMAHTKASAESLAKRMRKKGFTSSIFKRKKGYGISVTRNIKK